MDMLKEMFPQHDEGVIRAVLEQVNGDIEEASAVLLSPGFQPSNPPKPIAHVPAQPERPLPERRKRFEDDWTRSPKRTIGERLEIWRSEGKRTDVALICNDGDVILAHKLVLSARSQILGVMLMTMATGGNEDSVFFEINSKAPITIDSIPPDMARLDMDMNGQICRKILKYLYTDILDEVSVEEAPSLHEAALTLDLEFIKRKCEGADKLPPPTYASDFLALLYDPEHAMSDMELVSEEGGEVYYVHKLLMGCVSEYFEEMMGGRYIEGFERRIEMKGVSEAELKLMVESVYVDGRIRKGSVDEKNAFQVFLKANQFLFRSLQAASEEVMSQFLDEENVLVLLGDEIVRTSPTMKRNCLEFISKQYEKMHHLDGYKQLPTLLQLEVEHYAAKRNEEMFTALIATMSDGINISDFNSLVQDEISDFLESQLSHISIDDIQDSIKFQCAEKCAEQISLLESSSPSASAAAALQLLHPPQRQNVRYRLSDISLAPPPSKNLHCFDDASRLVSVVESVATNPSVPSQSSSSAIAASSVPFAQHSTSSASADLSSDDAPVERKHPKNVKKHGGLGQFGRVDARRRGTERAFAKAASARVHDLPFGHPARGRGFIFDDEDAQHAGRQRRAYSPEGEQIQNRQALLGLDGGSLSSTGSSDDSSSSSSEEDGPNPLHAAFIGFERPEEENRLLRDIAGSHITQMIGGAGNEEIRYDIHVLPYRANRSTESSDDPSTDLEDTAEADDDDDEIITSTDMDTDIEEEYDETVSSEEEDYPDLSSSSSSLNSSASSSLSGSFSSSSSSHVQFFGKDSVSAVFSPTRLSILATDISLMIEDAKFRFEAIPEHEKQGRFGQGPQSASSFEDPFNSDGDAGKKSSPAIRPDTGSSLDVEGSIDSGKTNILLSGVSFALSFSFSFQNNKLLGQVSKVLQSAERKAGGRGGFNFEDSDDELSSSSDDDSDDLEDLLNSDSGGGAASDAEVPLLSLQNFSCDVDQLRMQFLPSHRDMKRLLEPVATHQSASSSTVPQAEPKLTVFSRPAKYGAPPAPQAPNAAPMAPSEDLDTSYPLQAAPTTPPQVPLPTRAHPLLWFPHYSSQFKQSLKGALVAAIQTQMADSLARLTTHLNRMSLRQLSSLTSGSGGGARKPSAKHPPRNPFF
jgi:hypothetical protein